MLCPLAPPEGGGHYADVILRDAQGPTLDWGTRYFNSTSGAEITSISTEKKSYKLDEPVPIRIALAGDLARAKLAVKVLDTHGRLVWSSTVAAEPQISLQADVADVLTIQCGVRATLRKGIAVLAKRTGKVLVRQPPEEVMGSDTSRDDDQQPDGAREMSLRKCTNHN